MSTPGTDVQKLDTRAISTLRVTVAIHSLTRCPQVVHRGVARRDNHLSIRDLTNRKVVHRRAHGTQPALVSTRSAVLVDCSVHVGPRRNQRFGGEGEQARKLEREGLLGTEGQCRRSIETPETSRTRHSEQRAMKVMGGGSAKALPRPAKESPRKLKAQEGIESPES